MAQRQQMMAQQQSQQQQMQGQFVNPSGEKDGTLKMK